MLPHRTKHDCSLSERKPGGAHGMRSENSAPRLLRARSTAWLFLVTGTQLGHDCVETREALPRSRLIWSVVTEVSSGSVRGILLLKLSCLRALVTRGTGIAGWRSPAFRDETRQRFGEAMNSSNTVAAELGLRLVVPEHDGVPSRRAFTTGPRTRTPSAWRFMSAWTSRLSGSSRGNLLAGGMTEPAGDGDVRVWPADTPTGQRVLNISLSSAVRPGPLRGPADRAGRLPAPHVPGDPGRREGEYINLDGELNQLLRRS